MRAPGDDLRAPQQFVGDRLAEGRIEPGGNHERFARQDGFRPLDPLDGQVAGPGALEGPIVDGQAGRRGAGRRGRHVPPRPLAIGKHQDASGFSAADQREGQIEPIGQPGSFAAHLGRETGELARLGRLLDRGRLGERHHGQVVAGAHGRMHDVGGLLLQGRAARRHRKASIGHQHDRARAKRQPHAQPAQRQHEQDRSHAAQAGHQPRGERPQPEQHGQRDRQHQPEWIGKGHAMPPSESRRITAMCATMAPIATRRKIQLRLACRS